MSISQRQFYGLSPSLFCDNVKMMTIMMLMVVVVVVMMVMAYQKCVIRQEGICGFTSKRDTDTPKNTFLTKNTFLINVTYVT